MLYFIVFIAVLKLIIRVVYKLNLLKEPLRDSAICSWLL